MCCEVELEGLGTQTRKTSSLSFGVIRFDQLSQKHTKTYPSKRPQPVWGSGRILYDNVDDADDDEDNGVAGNDVEDDHVEDDEVLEDDVGG